MGGEVIKMHKKFGQPKKGTTKMCFTTVFVEKNQGNSRITSEDFLCLVFLRSDFLIVCHHVLFEEKLLL